MYLDQASYQNYLFGIFCRAPNTTAYQYTRIEDSIHLALDTGINVIIITGDFNINTLNPIASRKINTLCHKFALSQCITEPTHFTEKSSSLIDIILTSNPTCISISGVGDPCLDQTTRYHCQVFGVLNLKKPKYPTFKRHIWLFDKGNYQLLRVKVATTNWEELKDGNINIYTRNITHAILNVSKLCMPNKDVTVRPSDPPWLSSNIKRHIRCRRRAYRKTKQSNSEDN